LEQNNPEAQRGVRNVRYGALADITSTSVDVRFTPKSGHGLAR
jgi:hypothetical protein